MTDYLVDNSVWARLATGDPAVTARLRRIERAPADLFVTCPPAGAIDILIAGYAIVNDATVLTADHDFDYIARVSDLQHEYVPPSW